MKVQEVLVNGYSKRYLLTYPDGIPIPLAAQYLKHLDNAGKSPNTQRTYCYALKHYYEYLEKYDLGLETIGLTELSNFLAWLRFPARHSSVLFLKPPKPVRCEKTANLVLSVVCSFYEYLYRSRKLEHDLNDRLLKLVAGPHKYKDFLYHVTRDQLQVTQYLKLKEPTTLIHWVDRKILWMNPGNGIILLTTLFATPMP